MYKKILVPLDGSKRAEAILPHVEELAGRYHATVILMQAVEPKVVINPEGGFMPSSVIEMDVDKKEVESYLAGLKENLEKKEIEAKTIVLKGPIVEAIINTADQEGVDLIAMSSHGRGGIARVFYGSVAAGILHRVDRPLLIIRSRATQKN